MRGLAIGFILNQAPVYNDMSYSKCSGVTNGGEVRVEESTEQPENPGAGLGEILGAALEGM